MKRTGQTGEIEGAPLVRRDAKGFVTTERTWTGFLDEMNAKGATLDTAWTISQFAGPVYKLVSIENGNTTDGSGGGGAGSPEEQVVTVWDLKVSQHRRDLWELPIIAAEFLKLKEPEDRTRILNLVKDFGRGELIYQIFDEKTGDLKGLQLTSKYILELAVSKGMRFDVMTAFLSEIARGVDSFLHNTFVLSKKRVGPAAAASLAVEFVLVNRALSTPTLLSRERSIPPAIATPISGQLQSGAWIRQADELNQLDSTRIEINSQWIWAQDYSILIYGTPE